MKTSALLPVPPLTVIPAAFNEVLFETWLVMSVTAAPSVVEPEARFSVTGLVNPPPLIWNVALLVNLLIVGMRAAENIVSRYPRKEIGALPFRHAYNLPETFLDSAYPQQRMLQLLPISPAQRKLCPIL